MKNAIKKLWKEYRYQVEIFLVLGACCALMLIFKIPCPIKHLTGLSCAGCGMTRAMISALRLDFAAAFEYHPLWVMLLPFGVSYAVFSHKNYKLAMRILVIVAVSLLLGVWFFRLIRGDSIVAFDFEGSAVNMLIRKITEIHNLSRLFSDYGLLKKSFTSFIYLS